IASGKRRAGGSRQAANGFQRRCAMKFLGLIRANLFRKKIRFILTIGSFAVALFLFGILAVVRVAFSGGVDIAGADRLVVINRTSIIQPLPFAYADKINRIPIKGTFLAGVWEFNLDGIYHGTRQADDETQFWFQWKRLEEQVPERLKGQVGWYTVKLDRPDDSLRISKAIDTEFANSPFET